MTKRTDAESDQRIADALHSAAESTGWTDAQALIDYAVSLSGEAEGDVRRVYDARFRVWAP